MKKLISLLLVIAMFSFALPFAVLAEPDDGTQPEVTEEAIDTPDSDADAVDENAPAEDGEDNEEQLPDGQDEEITPGADESVEDGDTVTPDDNTDANDDDADGDVPGIDNLGFEEPGIEEPSQAETEEPTEEPSQTATEEPTEEPSQTETEESTEEPSQTETDEPGADGVIDSIEELLALFAKQEPTGLNMRMDMYYLGIDKVFLTVGINIDDYSDDELPDLIMNDIDYYGEFGAIFPEDFVVDDMESFVEVLAKLRPYVPSEANLSNGTTITVRANSSESNHFSVSYGDDLNNTSSNVYTYTTSYNENDNKDLVITPDPGYKISVLTVSNCQAYIRGDGNWEEISADNMIKDGKATFTAADLKRKEEDTSSDGKETDLYVVDSGGFKKYFTLVVTVEPLPAKGITILEEKGTYTGANISSYTGDASGTASTFASIINGKIERGDLKAGNTVTLVYPNYAIKEIKAYKYDESRSDNNYKGDEITENNGIKTTKFDDTHTSVAITLNTDRIVLESTYNSPVGNVTIAGGSQIDNNTLGSCTFNLSYPGESGSYIVSAQNLNDLNIKLKGYFCTAKIDSANFNLIASASTSTSISGGTWNSSTELSGNGFTNGTFKENGGDNTISFTTTATAPIIAIVTKDSSGSEDAIGVVVVTNYADLKTAELNSNLSLTATYRVTNDGGNPSLGERQTKTIDAGPNNLNEVGESNSDYKGDAYLGFRFKPKNGTNFNYGYTINVSGYATYGNGDSQTQTPTQSRNVTIKKAGGQ